MLSLPHGRLLLIIGWLLIITVVVLSLGPQLPRMGWGSGDKVQHAFAYFVLMSWFSGLYARERHVQLAGAFVVLGISLEILQGALTTSRQMDWHDAVANTTGIVIALVLARFGLADWARRIEGWLTRRTSPGGESR